MDRNWIELTPRLPKSGLLPDDPQGDRENRGGREID